MAGGKETGRQKMIGMMYLVLTALLAMNVSKEVVNAFVTIDQDQGKNLSAIDNKLSGQLSVLATNAQESPDKYGPASSAANSIHEEASKLIEHINEIKAKTFAITLNGAEADISEEIYSNGKFLIDLDSIKALVGIDNYDNNTNLMIGDAAAPISEPSADGNNYTAIELRNKLEAYRDLVISKLQKFEGTEKLIDNVKNTFDYPLKDDPRLKEGEEEWIVKNFYHVPLAASTAMLSGLQNQVRLAESDLVDQLYTDVEGSSFKFNRLKGAVIPMATTIPQGSKFQADVFLAAYDDQNTPEIFLGTPGAKWDSIAEKMTGGEPTKVKMEGTMGKVEIPAGSLGVSKRSGYIVFTPIGGQPVKQPFDLEYNVVAPQLVVSPTKMNVFYKGVPNPVSVSVPGYTDRDIVATITGGTMRPDGGGGNYVVTPGSGKEANINATVTQPDGSKRSLGPVKFRVKRIPDPVPSFGQKKPSDNVIPGTAVRAAQGVRAVMENFDFDISVTVASFKVVVVVNGEIREAVCQGNKLNGQAKGLLESMRRGQKFSIEEIKVNMPDGVRKVPGISLRII